MALCHTDNCMASGDKASLDQFVNAMKRELHI